MASTLPPRRRAARARSDGPTALSFLLVALVCFGAGCARGASFVAFSPDGRTIAAGRSGHVSFHDATDGHEIGSAEVDRFDEHFAGRMDRARVQVFGPDGRSFTTLGGYAKIYVLGVPDGRLLLEREPALQDPTWVNRVQLAPNGEHALVEEADPARVRLLRLPSGELEAEVALPVRSGPVVLSDDFTRFAFASDDSLEVWDLRQGKRLAALPTPPPETIALSADGKRAVTLPRAADEATLWDVDAGKALQKVRANPSHGLRASLGPGVLALFSTEVGWGIRSFRTDDGSELRTSPEEGRVDGLCFSADGKAFASWQWDAGVTVRRVDTAEVRPLPSLLGEAPLVRTVQGCEFAPDGRHLLVSGSAWPKESYQQGRYVHVAWSLERWREEQRIEGMKWRLAWSPDGTRLAGFDGEAVRLWPVPAAP